jgi:hypothetical protein
MNNTQRFVILDKKTNRIIGTDSGCAFTEASAHQKCALLQQELDPDRFTVVELTKFFMSMMP